jgi:hypothetical protein
MGMAKGLPAIVLMVLLAQTPLQAGAFEDHGLHPAVIIAEDNAPEAFANAKSLLKDARGIGFFPPHFIFCYVPAGFQLDNEAGLVMADSADDPSVMRLGPVERGIIESLFGREELMKEGVPPDAGPIRDKLFMVPPEVVEKTKYTGPLRGSPSELQDRGINQNSEFMLGSVLVNIVTPESVGGSESWTEEEIAAALSKIAIGCQEYQHYAVWTDLRFIYNYKDFLRIPISREPIEGDWTTDPLWISEVFENLGYYDESIEMQIHLLNNETRAEHHTDWVFTALIVDASENGCWQGSQAGNYVAYATYNGPYLLMPYPACGFGDGIGSSLVFIHEMSHVFWALDEYSTFFPCEATAGYLAVPNKNNWVVPCQEVVPCIMSGGYYEKPLPICSYTLGQVGLEPVDYLLRTVPAVYDVHPSVKFAAIPGVNQDTVFTMPYEVAMHVWNDPVPNRNPVQDEELRIDYAAEISEGSYWIGFTPIETELEEPSGGWDSDNWVTHTFPNLEPGRTELHFKFENHVGLSTQISKSVYYIGIKYFFTSLEPFEDHFDINWATSDEIFGAVFDVVREDVTAGAGRAIIGTVTEPENPDPNSSRLIFSFCDEDIEPAHEYRYCIIGRFNVTIDGENQEFLVPTGDMCERSWIPRQNDLVSYLLPNPTSTSTSITVDIPKSYYDPAGGQEETARAATLNGAPLVEVLTPLDIGVYNIKGQRIATVYNNRLYGETRTFTWNGTDLYGKPVAQGVYFMRIAAGNRVATKKVVIIR